MSEAISGSPFPPSRANKPSNIQRVAPGDRLLGWQKSLGNSLVFEGAGIGGAVGRMTGNGKNCPQTAGQGQAESQVTSDKMRVERLRS